MATLQVGLGADDFMWLPDLLHPADPLDVQTASDTEFVFLNRDGDTVRLIGSGFAYKGNGDPKSGTVTQVIVSDGPDTKLTISGLSTSFKSLGNLLIDGSDYDAMALALKGKDKLLGTSENDSLGGYSPGDDIVKGGDGDDYINGDRGKDSLDGGANFFDTLSYGQSFYDKSAKKGVVLDVAKGTATDPWGDKDKFKNFEDFWGSKFDDKFTGDGREYTKFAGLKGDDRIDGKGGFDTADYSQDYRYKGKKGIKADLTTGKIKDGFGDTDKVKNIEEVRGTKHDDTFKGSGEDESFQGIGGKDKADGKGGFDQLDFGANDYNNGKHGVHLDAGKGKVFDDGYGNAETFKNFEKFIGTRFGDTLVGSKNGDELRGEDGNDTLTGKGGADVFGFVYRPDDATNHDTITDFRPDQNDKIALWIGVFTEISPGGDKLDAGQFIANSGGNATDGDQRILYDTGTGDLYYDPDGTGGEGRMLVATLTGAPAIDKDDFIVWT